MRPWLRPQGCLLVFGALLVFSLGVSLGWLPTLALTGAAVILSSLWAEVRGWRRRGREDEHRPWRARRLRPLASRSQLRAGARLAGADLREANLTRLNLKGIDLEGALLQHAQLSGADLSGANLRGADLRMANLEGADLQGASLREACLTGAVLHNARLRGADVSGADMSDNPWGPGLLYGADLTDVLYDSRTRWPLGFRPVVCRRAPAEMVPAAPPEGRGDEVVGHPPNCRSPASPNPGRM